MNEELPKPPEVALPHPTDLAGLYEACDIAEDTLERKPYYTDEAIAARHDTLWLARALAISNTPVALHMLRLTATSTNIWGDHNTPLIKTAREIARQTAPHHPAVAAQFAALACKLCRPGDADEQVALQDLEAYLQPCAANNPELACQLAEETGRYHHGPQGDAIARAGLHELETRLAGQPALLARVKATEARLG